MKTSTFLVAMVPLISALTIPGFSNGAMIALQAADDMPHATSCSIFCIGLTKCCPSGMCVAAWESC
ncbi:hypothetical protein DER45DRAFT_640284 [Fusarium avenaceum]|nr:hypothetical protein DER45DRAFT_640284 [Fusarium avenaceum]